MFSVALILLLAAGSCVNSIDLIQPDSMVVQPRQSLTITCQVSGYSLTDNSYATGWIRQCEGKPMDWIFHQWGGGDFYQNDALKNRFTYSRDTSAGTVTIKGQNLQPEDTAVYYCVRRPGGGGAFDYWGKGTMVTVTSATSTGPTVFPLMPCGSGTGDITLGCLASGFTPSSLTYEWSKDGTVLPDFIQYPPVQKGEVYTGISQIQVSRQDWDTMKTFQCAVTHAAGNAQCSFTKPTVYTRLPDLSLLASCDEKSVGSFSCFAKDFSPKEYAITWLKNGGEVSNKIYEINTPLTERVENEIKLYSAASFLRVPSTEWIDGTSFTCEFEGKGENHTYVNETVTKISDPSVGCPDMDIKITGPEMDDIFVTKKGTIVCQITVKTAKLGKTVWEDEKGNELVASSNTSGDYGATLTLDITYQEWTSGIKRYCVVEHSECIDPVKTPYERKVGGPVQRPSVFMLSPVEQTKTDTVTLTCYVKDFSPQEVLVSWLVDDERADSQYQVHTTNVVDNHGTFSAYGQMTLSLDQWKNNDVVYSCVVHHESLVNITNAIVRSIGHRTFEKTNLVNLHMNIPETCKAQ